MTRASGDGAVDSPGEVSGARLSVVIGGGIPLTRLIGRQTEQREVSAALREHRLVTLTGIGGVGKTRLARSVVDGWRGETAWADLTLIDDPILVVPTVGRSLGLVEAPRGDPAARVIDAVGDRALLLVVDNCEHLVDAVAGLVERLLSSCPRLRVLTTSRESLRSAGERVWPVPALSVDAAGDELPDAVRLFVERARSVGAAIEPADATIEEVVTLCRCLDGIPLAIELAAARARLLGVSQTVAALDDALGVLTRGTRTGAARHQTLERSLAWSYDLLDHRERALLRRLSVFAGEVSVSAARAVCSGAPVEPDETLDVMAALVDKSLLQPIFRGGQARYRLLEVVRQFARHQLEVAGEADVSRRRHAAWVADEVGRRTPDQFGDRIVEVFDDLELVLDDVRAATTRALAEHDRDLALRVLSDPLLFWICRHPAEGRRAIEEALAAEGTTEPRTLAQAHVTASWLCFYVWDAFAAQAHAERAAALATDIDDPVLQAQADTLYAWALVFLSPASAAPALDTAVKECREADDRHHLAHAVAGLAFSALHHGRPDDALEHLAASLAIAREVGDQVGIRRALAFSGAELTLRGEFADAEARFAETEQITRRLGDRYFLTQALDYLGLIALHHGDLDAARTRIAESLETCQQSSVIAIARSHTMAGLLHLAAGELDVAAAEADHALTIVEEVA